ncbi:hypothetical protein AAFF_G00114840 [Aldrovandia affinis]|uniref:Solute carrier family 15 member 1 n=1 Tax=Aldrovandia affinis TaxID=143900 RepID=A0AAD7RTB9_9TELE|nr:hypothetical protein AAFF_G00114840 [Aldrovandia affinis]
MSDTEKQKKSEKKSKKKVEVCGYPLSIFFIVVNEFCERFSYYGMRAVLVLYFKYFLKWDDDLSTSIYHTFVALCYLTPILGAIVADSWLGKFNDQTFPKIKTQAQKMLVLFGSTYVCEQTFSVMKYNKSKNRSSVSDDHLAAVLRIATSELTPDFTSLVLSVLIAPDSLTPLQDPVCAADLSEYSLRARIAEMAVAVLDQEFSGYMTGI